MGEIERRAVFCRREQWRALEQMTNEHARTWFKSEHLNVETIAQHQGMLALMEANARQTWLLLMRGPDRHDRKSRVEQVQRGMEFETQFTQRLRIGQRGTDLFRPDRLRISGVVGNSTQVLQSRDVSDIRHAGNGFELCDEVGEVLAERLADQGITATASYPQEDAIHDSEEGPASLLRNGERPSSESEAGPKPAPDGALRNPKQDRTVRSSRIDEVRTTAQARALGDLQWPKRFAELKAEQQAGARMALQQVDAALRQAVLDEWAARCGKHGIRNPAGYLFGIIQRAMRGEFNAWAKQTSPAAPTPSAARAPPPEPPRNVVPPAVARQHIERLRDLLRKS